MSEDAATPLIANSILLMIVVAAVFLLLTLVIIIRQRKKVPVSGGEEMVGQEAMVKKTLSPAGEVFLMGELWKAQLESGTALPGEKVRVRSIKGLVLIVEKI